MLEMSDEDKGREDKSSKLVKLVRRLSSDHDDEVLAAVRLIGATLKSRGSDIHDLADSIQELEEGNGGGGNAEFYKKAWLDGYIKGAEDERKKMPRNAAIGFGAADSDELTCEAAVLFAHQNLSRLNSWERNFIEDMAIQMRHAPSKSFSEKQTALIFKIYRRAGGKI
jgi:hypothetical protein